MSTTPKALISSNQNEVFVQNQNTYGAVPFNTPLAGGHTAVIVVKTAEALTAEALAALFDGEGESAEIIAQDNVPAIEGYDAALDGRLHVKYAAAAAQNG